MPRRSILSATERDSLLALPDTQDELIVSMTRKKDPEMISHRYRMTR